LCIAANYCRKPHLSGFRKFKKWEVLVLLEVFSDLRIAALITYHLRSHVMKIYTQNQATNV
jgi:hypothetical protein